MSQDTREPVTAGGVTVLSVPRNENRSANIFSCRIHE
jgi:hypothetical protein